MKVILMTSQCRETITIKKKREEKCRELKDYNRIGSELFFGINVNGVIFILF